YHMGQAHFCHSTTPRTNSESNSSLNDTDLSNSSKKLKFNIFKACAGRVGKNKKPQRSAIIDNSISQNPVNLANGDTDTSVNKGENSKSFNSESTRSLSDL